MKVRDINWGLVAGIILTLFIWTLAIMAIIFSLSGCTQAIVTKPDGTRYQWNTFFQKLDIGRLKTANLLLEKYSEEPGSASVKVNPWEYEAEIGDDK